MTKKITKKDFIEFGEYKRDLFTRRPDVKMAYDALAPKYALISAMLDARNKKGMTQAEIALRAGTTQSAIARFESGRTNPTLDFASRLSRAVGAKLEIRLSK
ncbi:MAG: helix-turn-helix transcriptional regulator [Candidatus Kaiserbacteria bacterium]|nr:helix-turn-helix transcriptional regulator [Candidatus Kaiserbacteria bacterium]